MSVVIGNGGLTADAVVHIARSCPPVELSPVALAGIEAGYGCLERQGQTGQKIYGVSTGLGAAVDTTVALRSGSGQHLIPQARAVGVGRTATETEVRAIIAARLSRVCIGHSGMSLQTANALLQMLNHRIVPQVPIIGSVGESDLAPLAHIADVLTGRGRVLRADGSVTDGACAFAEANLTLPEFGIKDGLALVSSNAAALGLAALAVAEVRHLFAAQVAAITLSYEGFRASVDPLDPAVVALRPAPGQARVARVMRALLDKGALLEPGSARRLQDPLSLRCGPSVLGAVYTAMDQASDAVALELRTSDDNPAVDTANGRVVPTGNFDPTHVALAFDTLALALARLGAMTGERIMKLMSAEMSGLPRFLAPDSTGSNGFATVQKTVSALVATIAHQAMPLPFAALPVADRVEDYASLLMPGVEKFAPLLENLHFLVGIELMVAAQAVDLRGDLGLGHGTGRIHHAVRSLVAPLTSDRATSGDMIDLACAIQHRRFGAILDEIERDFD